MSAAITDSDIEQALFEMVDRGWLEMGIDEDGEFTFWETDLGEFVLDHAPMKYAVHLARRRADERFVT